MPPGDIEPSARSSEPTRPCLVQRTKTSRKSSTSAFEKLSSLITCTSLTSAPCNFSLRRMRMSCTRTQKQTEPSPGLHWSSTPASIAAARAWSRTAMRLRCSSTVRHSMPSSFSKPSISWGSMTPLLSASHFLKSSFTCMTVSFGKPAKRRCLTTVAERWLSAKATNASKLRQLGVPSRDKITWTKGALESPPASSLPGSSFRLPTMSCALALVAALH
mmetsp:Transcript_112997/g.300184  ORF Transcript_112997/g.300184 Transcript_112997/m.300184 type:complete len:218 (-) Transcript_112997:148-801(-)